MKSAILALCVLSIGTNAFAQWQQTTYMPSPGGILTALAQDSFLLAGANCTSGGELFLSTDEGVSWNPVSNNLPPFTNVNSGAIVNGSFFMSTLNYSTSGNTFNGIHVSQDEGNSWTAVNSGISPAHYQVNSMLADGNNLFAGTSGGGIYVTSNQGSNWTLSNSGLFTGANVWALQKAGSYLFAGTDHGLYRSANNGTTWSSANSGLSPTFNFDTVVKKLAVAGTKVFAVVDGKLFSSDNFGSSWNAIATPLPSYDTWEVIAIDTTLFISKSGVVLLSYDLGSNWININGNLTAAIHSLAVNENYLFGGTWSSGQVFKRTYVGAVPTSIEAGEVVRSAKIVPNPLIKTAKLILETPLKNGTLEIYTITGVKVRKVDHLSGNSIELAREQLPAGIYSVHVREDDRMISAHKLQIAD